MKIPRGADGDAAVSSCGARAARVLREPILPHLTARQGNGIAQRVNSDPISPWSAGARALRRFARPFLLIQMTAISLVVAHHLSANVRSVCAALAQLRADGGLPVAALAGAIAGGVLPEFAKWISNPKAYQIAGRSTDLLFNLVFFALNGVVVDRFYHLLGVVLGDQATLGTVIGKVACDQFIFSPTWLPLIIALFAWRQANFRFSETVVALKGNFYRRRVIPLLLPNWAFWIPMTSVIYALPGPLQFLMFALALGAWSLIMVVIAEAKTEEATS